MKRALSALAVSALIGPLAGCAGTDGVLIPSGAELLKPCKFGRTIEVEDLAEIGEPGCDMAGATIRFADGSTGEVGSVGAAKSWSYSVEGEGDVIPNHFTMVNWGVPGVAVAEFDTRERLKRIWASSEEASDLQRELD